jgi:hypothetical protein
MNGYKIYLRHDGQIKKIYINATDVFDAAKKVKSMFKGATVVKGFKLYHRPPLQNSAYIA